MLFTRAGLTLCLFVLSASATLRRIKCPSKDKKGHKKSLVGNKVFSFDNGLLRCEYKGGAGQCDYSSKSPHHLMMGSDDCPVIKEDKHKGVIHHIFFPKTTSSSHSSTATASSSTKHRKNKHSKTKSASSTSSTHHASSTSTTHHVSSTTHKAKKFKTSRSATSTANHPTMTVHMGDPAIRVGGAVSTINLDFSPSKTTSHASSSHTSSSTTSTATASQSALSNVKFISSGNATNATSNLAKNSATVGVVGQSTVWALIPAAALALMAL